jgi:hypothetical protein
MKAKRGQLARGVWVESPQIFALEELARMAETTAEVVRHYCELGLLGEEGREGQFGEGTLFLVRRIEQLRIEYGMPAQGAGLVLDLAARIEELEGEIRALREAMGR